MSSWALVVGCAAYPNLDDAAAVGAVDDALAFRHWLLTDGGVPPANLRLLVSESTGRSSLPDGITVDGPADFASFSREVAELVTARAGDRLYVYFAGHGTRSHPASPYFSQDVLVLTDFDPQAPPAACLAVRELRTQLAQSDFGEVIVILDAARRFPFAATVALQGFGGGWQGRRRSGAVVQFLIQATSVTSVGRSLTAVLLEGLAGKAGTVMPGDCNPDESPTVVRWSSLVQYLRAALQSHPPVTIGQDASLELARFTGPPALGHAAGRAEPGLPTAVSEFRIRSADPNAMLTIEDLAGRRLAVGVGSIEGHLPGGPYVAVLIDPGGVDSRVGFELTGADRSVVVLDPAERQDDFRIDHEPALRWSSPSAQLAAATASIWSYGHRSFVLVGWSGQPDHGAFSWQPPWDWADSVVPSPSEMGALAGPENGWWKAFPISRPWCTLRAGSHTMTVPVAPDSVTAVAITAQATTVALFDTTHALAVQIAAQDRVQQYLAIGRLGAADLTSRFAVVTQHRWPWGATAAVRRLIDGAHRARDEGSAAADAEQVAVNPGSVSSSPDDPSHQFVARVPASERHRLVGNGPWAVWLDWP